MHHNRAFYTDEWASYILSRGPAYINVFVLPGFREPPRHIFGSASIKRREDETFWKQKPSYRIVVRKK